MKILTGTGTRVFILRTTSSFRLRLLEVSFSIHFLESAFTEVTLGCDRTQLLSLYTLLSSVLFVWRQFISFFNLSLWQTSCIIAYLNFFCSLIFTSRLFLHLFIDGTFGASLARRKFVLVLWTYWNLACGLVVQWLTFMARYRRDFLILRDRSVGLALSRLHLTYFETQKFLAISWWVAREWLSEGRGYFGHLIQLVLSFLFIWYSFRNCICRGYRLAIIVLSGNYFSYTAVSCSFNLLLAELFAHEYGLRLSVDFIWGLGRYAL